MTDRQGPDIPSTDKVRQHWPHGPLAANLFGEEKNRCAKYLAKLFGYHLLKIGDLGHSDLLNTSSISHKIVMHFIDDNSRTDSCDFLGDQAFLPIASDSMDVVVLSHVLEFVDNPHKLLREVERTLIGEGHLVIIGFNPWSLWGLWRALLFWRERPPWNGHFYGMARIKDWLTLLDLEFLESERFFYRPPIKNSRWLQKLVFVESIGKHCWPFFGGVYVILAKKRVVPLTPMKMRWRARRQLIASGLVEPGSPV